MRPSLESLAIKYSSDKYYRHSYIPVYERLFQGVPVRRLLEVGIGFKDLMVPFLPKGVEYVHGSSLRMWREYWPGADIYACDIREDALIQEYRIISAVCDQSKLRSLFDLKLWASNSRGCWFDVIIDDGSHQFNHQLLTAAVLLPTLVTGGVYVIEDTYPDKGAELAAMFGGELIVGSK